MEALKIASSLTGSFITAGTPFTITTSVTNAHEGQIEIIQFMYHIPYQVQWIHDVQYDAAYKALAERSAFMRRFSGSPWRAAAQPPGQRMAFSNTEQPGAVIATVLPGETTIYAFKALVPGWLFATGTEVTFEGNITYRYNNDIHTSRFQTRIPIRPPLRSNIIGAIAGGVLGSLAKLLRESATSQVGIIPGNLTFLSAAGLAMILGVIMVVFASRRTTEVQPILTIEDFWGGLLAGFLVGYVGHEFFGKVVTIAR